MKETANKFISDDVELYDDPGLGERAPQESLPNQTELNGRLDALRVSFMRYGSLETVALTSLGFVAGAFAIRRLRTA